MSFVICVFGTLNRLSIPYEFCLYWIANRMISFLILYRIVSHMYTICLLTCLVVSYVLTFSVHGRLEATWCGGTA